MKRLIAIVAVLTITILGLGAKPKPALAACDDEIFDPGTGLRVLYKNCYASFPLFQCESKGGQKNAIIPVRRGRDCAAPRIDGCSIPSTVGLSFTKRDHRLMKAACNEHDRCYSTHGIPKSQCDADLWKNLSFIKNKFNGYFTVKAVVGGVLAFGDESYSAGQSWGKSHNCSIRSSMAVNEE